MTRAAGRPVRIGVVGCGRLARSVHLPNLARTGGAEVVALADPDPGALAAARRVAPRAARYASAAELLAGQDVDAVLVATPPSTHAELALAALAAGKPVYVEKPLATTLADAERLLSAWRASGLVAMVGFAYRFNRLYLEARERTAAGALGEVVAARAAFSTALAGAPAWRQDARTGGGPLVDLVSHDADLVRFVLGREVAEVLATAGAGETLDTVAVTLRLDDGVPVQIHASHASVEAASLEVYGRRGAVSVDRYGALRPRVSGLRATGPAGRAAASVAGLARLPYLLARLRAPAAEPAFAAALAAFAEGVRTGTQPAPDPADGFASLAIVLAAAESLRTGRPVAPAPTPAS